MPAFVVATPSTPKSFDLRDAVSPIDRNLEGLQQACVLAQGMIQGIYTNPATGAVWSANTMPRPAYITSGGGITSYETAVSDALTALTTALVALQSIPSLT